MSSEDNVTEYRVSIPPLLSWPIHIAAWIIATVLRALFLILLIAGAIAAYGVYVDNVDKVAPPPAHRQISA